MHKLLRLILVLSLVAVSFGLAMITYHTLKGQFVWRIAIGTQRGDDPAMVEALGHWLAERNRRSRVEVVLVGSDAAALEAVRDGKADAALARGDDTIPGMFASVASLYPEVALVAGLPRTGITDWPQLRGKTVGLVGHTRPDDPLLQKVLVARNVTDVRFISIERKDFDAALARNAFQALAQVAPLNNQTAAEIRAGTSFRKLRKGVTVLDLADAESLASTDRRYVGYDVPGGGIRDLPPLPEEEISTLAVMRHLVVRGDTKAYTVQRLLIDLIDAKRGIAGAYPLARHIGSPGTDKDGAVKIHPAAVRYFNGEEIALADILLEWIYIIPMIAGALGAIGSWLANRFWRAEGPEIEDTIAELLRLRGTVSDARTLADLAPAESLLNTLSLAIGETITSDDLPEGSVTSALLALDLAERAVDKARLRLGGQG